MVIVYSYVSLPEGSCFFSPLRSWFPWDKHGSLPWAGSYNIDIFTHCNSIKHTYHTTLCPLYIYIYTINHPHFWFIVGLTTFLNRFYDIYIYIYILINRYIDIVYNTHLSWMYLSYGYQISSIFNSRNRRCPLIAARRRCFCAMCPWTSARRGAPGSGIPEAEVEWFGYPIHIGD